MRRNFVTLRVAEHWSSMPREVVEALSLEMFKACLGIFLYGLI